jgi:hypothetical protein
MLDFAIFVLVETNRQISAELNHENISLHLQR